MIDKDQKERERKKNERILKTTATTLAKLIIKRYRQRVADWRAGAHIHQCFWCIFLYLSWPHRARDTRQRCQCHLFVFSGCPNQLHLLHLPCVCLLLCFVSHFIPFIGFIHERIFYFFFLSFSRWAFSPLASPCAWQSTDARCALRLVSQLSIALHSPI